MSIRLRDAASSLRNVTSIRLRDAGSVLRPIRVVRMRDAANVLRVVWSGLTAVLSTEQVEGAVSSRPPAKVTTNSVTASPEGGVGPFTYAWSAINAPGWMINSPASDTTSFISPFVEAGNLAEGTFKCTITGGGISADTPTLVAAASNFGAGGELL